MKRRSSVQIIVDKNQNIRINNLSLDDYAEIFEDGYEEFNLCSEFTLDLNKTRIDIPEITHDIESTIQLYNSCEICFRKCKVNRNKNELGWCRLNPENNIYMVAILNDEEKMICPTYAIYLSSCNIACEFCHQKEFMQPNSRDYVSVYSVVEDIKNNINTIKTISFIGGNPDLSILTILRLVKLLKKDNIDLPLIFNSNFLFTKKLYPIIEKYFDVLIPDFKFWNSNCSKNICGLEEYKKIVQKNISYFIDKKPMIIRHLPLPKHWECCSKPIIDWICKNLNTESQYLMSFLDMLHYDNSKSVNKCNLFYKELMIKNI
ncbi:MAG: 4Fe-4S cluster-binding domain-containing protein [Candidatus Woesearchaeota archaeon]